MIATELLYQAAQTSKLGKLLVFNAQPHSLLKHVCSKSHDYMLVQRHKPLHQAIEDMALRVDTDISDHHLQTYTTALIFPSKNKTLTLSYMALAMHALKAQGKVIMACANMYGAKSYEKALGQIAGETSSSSKSKCRVFSAFKTDMFNHELAQQWIEAACMQYVNDLHLYSQPGLFSWNKADAGSKLLLKHLPSLSGEGMDLCCGYGLLATNILATYDDIQICHIIDADHNALLCAKKNTLAWKDKVCCDWLDATQGGLPKPLDWVVCNPPFHTGQAQDISLGQAIVAQGCRSLKRGGHIYIVANRKLPYEHVLEKHLRSYQTLVEQDGFKVIRGVR